MVAVTLAFPRPEESAQPAASPADVAAPAAGEEKKVDGRNRHHGHHGGKYNLN